MKKFEIERTETLIRIYSEVIEAESPEEAKDIFDELDMSGFSYYEKIQDSDCYITEQREDD